MGKIFNKIAIVIFVLLSVSDGLFGQDFYFSQYNASPLTLNPALSGLYEGNYRVNGIYRDQWRGSQLNPYTTFAASVDMRFDLSKQYGKYKDGFSGGMTFFRDIAGVYDLGTTGMQLTGAFHKALSNKRAQYLSAGISTSINQRSLDLGTINFQDSYNGLNAFDRQTLEELPSNSFSYMDLNVGINYAYAPTKEVGYSFGVAVAHFNRPEQSFYRNDISYGESPTVIPEARLPMKFTLHGSIVIPFERNEFQPKLMYAQQGDLMLAQLGANFRFVMDADNRNALHLGAWVRGNNRLAESFSMADIGVLFGYQLDTFIVGLSYDYNVLKFAPQKTPGTFELSVTYFGTYENNSGLCPMF